MPRWPQDSRDRLVDAAVGLFVERGFSAVTVDDIAHHAGISARTFFRHFPDKEEVLFAYDDELLPTLLSAIAGETTTSVTAEQDMERALVALATTMEPRREELAQRQSIIDSQVSLSGRELAKQAHWQRAVMAALVDRGYESADADLLAAIGFAVFRRALHSWLADQRLPDLATRVRSALPQVRSVLDSTRSIPG